MACIVPYPSVTFCPSCGERLEERSRDHGDVPHCDGCELTLWRNPVPAACATVVGSDQALLIERGRGADIGAWALPGGHIECDESARAGAVRELEEETNLTVEPSALTLIGEGFMTFESGETMVTFNYAAPAAAATGTVDAGDDAADARFWSREELVHDTPLLRASGLDQLLDAMATIGGDAE